MGISTTPTHTKLVQSGKKIVPEMGHDKLFPAPTLLDTESSSVNYAHAKLKSEVRMTLNMAPDNLGNLANIDIQLAKTERTLPIALLRAREAVMERIRPMLQKNDLTEQQWRILRVLQESDDIEATALADVACILPPSLTRILRSLEAQGFVQSRKGDTDRRRLNINLTRKGRDLIRGLSPDIVAMYQEIEQAIGAKRLAHILDELEFLSKALQQKA